MLLLACFEARLQCSDWLKMAKGHLYLKQTIDASHAWAVAKTNFKFCSFNFSSAINFCLTRNIEEQI